MTPSPLVVSERDVPFYRPWLSTLAPLSARHTFSDHIGAKQHEQRDIVARFQTALVEHLRWGQDLEGVEWRQEHSPNHATRDSIDIFGTSGDRLIAIELDKNRADQVAKKFVSRMAALPSTKQIYFVSLYYAGTDRMSPAECIKYFGYCKTLACRLGSHYAGFIIK